LATVHPLSVVSLSPISAVSDTDTDEHPAVADTASRDIRRRYRIPPGTAERAFCVATEAMQLAGLGATNSVSSGLVGLFERWDFKNQEAMERTNVQQSDENYRRTNRDEESRIQGVIAGISAIIGFVVGFLVSGGNDLSVVARLGIALGTAIGFVVLVSMAAAGSRD
jgi:hypothetical protein